MTIAEEFGEEKARRVIEAAILWTRPRGMWPTLDDSEIALMHSVAALWIDDSPLTETQWAEVNAYALAIADRTPDSPPPAATANRSGGHGAEGRRDGD
jgi:hypothetical protein